MYFKKKAKLVFRYCLYFTKLFKNQVLELTYFCLFLRLSQKGLLSTILKLKNLANFFDCVQKKCIVLENKISI